MKWFNDSKITLLLVVLVLWPALSQAQNLAPVADAGLPRYASVNPVTLDGTGSYDPDNSGPLSYSWRQIAGPSVTIADANTATPTISGFTQTSEIQNCEFELVVSDDSNDSLPDIAVVKIVPSFGGSALVLENTPFDLKKPTVIYFGGGDCVNGYAGQPWNGGPGWTSAANVIGFPYGYTPDSGAGAPTYYKYGDMIITFLSAVAPDYEQPIQTSGWSTGGQPAIDVAVRLNLMYRDARYAVNRVTFLDATPYCRDYSESIRSFLASSIDGEQCWIDNYVGAATVFHPSVLNVASSLSHPNVPAWYLNSLTGSDMNQFNNGVVAGAYWSVVGPGKNLQLASTPSTQTYNFKWYGDASSGYMDFYNESLYPGRLPEPVTLVAWADPFFADDDPNGVFLTCLESENAVGYQLLSGSDPHDVAHYRVMTDSNAPPIVRLTALPLDHSWWTVKARDAHGSTIYADPMRVDSRSGPDTFLIRLVDFNGDKIVDFKDFSRLAQYWFQEEPSVDVAPLLEGDGIVDVHDLAFLAECWLMEIKDHHLVAHWRLDEAEGNIAHDSANAKDGTLNGNPVWQPDGGKINGALEFDGIDDYVSTPFVLNPNTGAFSVFAWIKGGAPGQVIISQSTVSGAVWLCTDSSYGKLSTKLTDGNRFTRPLVSEFVITDGDWHRIGVVWDGSRWHLYGDGEELAWDTGGLAKLLFCDGGMYIGAGKTLDAAEFWSGLIDDVRIYDRAVTP